MFRSYMALRGGVARDERGASMVEYALLIALIAVVVIAGAVILGTALGVKFADFGNTVSSS